jgi:altronate hydrolase
MTTASSIRSNILKIHPQDNVLVALSDLRGGDLVEVDGGSLLLKSDVAAKHKFAITDLAAGQTIIMYGITVGKAAQPIGRGELLTTANVRHDTAITERKTAFQGWHAPDVSRWQTRTFLGYHRADGQVGTRNYWLVVPLVFCENRNVSVLKQAFDEELGFAAPRGYRGQVAELVRYYKEGKLDDINNYHPNGERAGERRSRVFPNIDGIKFLTHDGGCGGTREDATNLAGLIAGYIHHPNVAGATVLSLGCQNTQVTILQDQLKKRNPGFNKPVIVLEQQQSGSESAMLSEAIRRTFIECVKANEVSRQPAPLSRLTVALKCGGSDGFSGLSANPAIGHTSDILAALGGRTVLAEFPELCGVEQELANRCTSDASAERFLRLMREYNAKAKAVGSGFDMNPSPGNIKDGLITDAMKSAGAAKKGGTSPVTAVVDFPEYATEPGLNLLCTPGNDVECVTAQVAAGASVVLFTTGLGTPTGNPIAPVIKLSTNTKLQEKMSDIIDIDTGPIISGERSVPQMGEEVLELVVKVASGEPTKAELLGQDDFIPWKRGVSL